MDVVVSQSGRVHRPSCKHRGRTAPWDWAQRAARAEVAMAVFERGYAICKHCRPFSLELDESRDAGSQAEPGRKGISSTPPGDSPGPVPPLAVAR